MRRMLSFAHRRRRLPVPVAADTDASKLCW